GLALQRQLLEHGLDHEVAVGEVGEVGRRAQATDRRLALFAFELPLLDCAAEEVRDPLLRLLAQLRAHLAADGLVAGAHAHLRDPGPHRPEPNDSDLPDLHPALILERDEPSNSLLQSWTRPGVTVSGRRNAAFPSRPRSIPSNSLLLSLPTGRLDQAGRGLELLGGHADVGVAPEALREDPRFLD